MPSRAARRATAHHVALTMSVRRAGSTTSNDRPGVSMTNARHVALTMSVRRAGSTTSSARLAVSMTNDRRVDLRIARHVALTMSVRRAGSTTSSARLAVSMTSARRVDLRIARHVALTMSVRRAGSMTSSARLAVSMTNDRRVASKIVHRAVMATTHAAHVVMATNGPRAVSMRTVPRVGTAMTSVRPVALMTSSAHAVTATISALRADSTTSNAPVAMATTGHRVASTTIARRAALRIVRPVRRAPSAMNVHRVRLKSALRARRRKPRRFDNDRPPRRFEDRPPRPPRPERDERAPRQAEERAPRPAPQAESAGLVRLSKRMSELGLCSRREADEWIPRGWVIVDGEPVTELGSRVRPDAIIEIHQAARSEQGERVTVLLHKPVGYVSGQAEDGYQPAAALFVPENQWEGDPTRKRFAPWQRKALAPAGRLDIDSTGLLVLTQDGRVARHLIGEDSTVEKEYLVRVVWDSPNGRVEHDISKVFPEELIEKLRFGLSLDGEELKPAKVSWQNEEQLRFVLREGKKRQIRRMCEQVGLEVVGLKRIRMGSIVLGDLPVGQWRFLGPFEKF